MRQSKIFNILFMRRFFVISSKKRLFSPKSFQRQFYRGSINHQFILLSKDESHSSLIHRASLHHKEMFRPFSEFHQRILFSDGEFDREIQLCFYQAIQASNVCPFILFYFFLTLLFWFTIFKNYYRRETLRRVLLLQKEESS